MGNVQNRPIELQKPFLANQKLVFDNIDVGDGNQLKVTKISDVTLPPPRY